jgi:hypothetical protein
MSFNTRTWTRFLCGSALSFALLSVFAWDASAAGITVTGKVATVRVQHWAPNRACVNIASQWFLLDLATETGKATYSTALAALLAGKDMSVRYHDTEPLIGGCDTGTTMRPIYAAYLSAD